jgi:branched-chain amino acid transport system permease protein
VNNVRRARQLALLGLVVLIVVAPPLVIRDPYVMHLLVLSGIFVVLASSLNLVMGYSGLLSLGHHAFFGLGAYTSSLAALAGVPLLASLGLAGVAGAVLARLVGSVILRLRSAYFVIATIAVAEVLRILSLNWIDVTNGPMGIANVPPLAIGIPGTAIRISLASPFRAYYLVATLAVVTIAVIAWVTRSSIGIGLVAMREAEHVARAVGIDTGRYALYSVIIGSSIAALAGALYAHYVQFVSPEVFLFLIMITIVVMVLAGGMGTLVGPVLGAAIFTLVPEFLRAGDELRILLYGAIIVLLVRFAPEGLWGLVLARGRRRAPAQPGLPPPAAAQDEGPHPEEQRVLEKRQGAVG